MLLMGWRGQEVHLANPVVVGASAEAEAAAAEFEEHIVAIGVVGRCAVLAVARMKVVELVEVGIAH